MNKKNSIFFIVGAVLLLMQFLYVRLWNLDVAHWSTSKLQVAISVGAAIVWELAARRAAGVRFESFRFSTRYLVTFVLSLLIWALVVSLSIPDMLQSTTLYRYLLNSFIIFFLTSALIEVTNLIRIGKS